MPHKFLRVAGLPMAAMGLSISPAAHAQTREEYSTVQEMLGEYRYGYAAGLAHLRQAADGDQRARRTRGMMLLGDEALHGAEVPTNRKEGLCWLPLAAADGCDVSRRGLAKLEQPGS